MITNSRAIILSAICGHIMYSATGVGNTNEFEALYSVVALLISALVIQTLYATVIRPQPKPFSRCRRRRKAHLPAPLLTRNLRSPFVILKDYEQETALILACWALALIGHQAHAVTLNRRLLSKQYVDVGEVT